MKKWYLLALVLVLLVLSLTGCTEKSKLDPDNPVILSMWHVYGENADAPMNRRTLYLYRRYLLYFEDGLPDRDYRNVVWRYEFPSLDVALFLGSIGHCRIVACA